MSDDEDTLLAAAASAATVAIVAHQNTLSKNRKRRSWLGPVPGADFNLNVLASSHSSQDKCRHVSDSRHSLLFCLHFTSNCCLKLHKISNITDQLKSLSEKQYRQLQQANTKNNSRSSRLFTLPWKKSCGRPCMLVIP